MVTKRWRIAKDSNKPDLVRVLSRRGISVSDFLSSKDLSSKASIERLLEELQVEHSVSDSFLEALERACEANRKAAPKKAHEAPRKPAEPVAEDLAAQSADVAVEESEEDDSEPKKNNKKKKSEV